MRISLFHKRGRSVSQTDPKWYLLAIIVVAIFAIATPRLIDFPAYSDEGAYEICHEIAMEYKAHAEGKASEAEWQQFEANAMPRLDDVSNDIKKHWRSSETGAAQVLYQASKYELPSLISQRGKVVDRRAEDTLNAALVQARHLIDAPTPIPEVSHDVNESTTSTLDPLVVAILLGDIALAFAGYRYWLRVR